MAECRGFSDRFNDRFLHCVAAVSVAEPLRGVPGVPFRRRRLRPIEAGGAGFIIVIAPAHLSAGKAVAGSLPIVVEGHGFLSLTQAPQGAAALSVQVSALLAVGAGLQGALSVAPEGFGRVQLGFTLSGQGSQPVGAAALASLGRSLRGTAELSPLAGGTAELDDEQTVLGVLGLPSETWT